MKTAETETEEHRTPNAERPTPNEENEKTDPHLTHCADSLAPARSDMAGFLPQPDKDRPSPHPALSLPPPRESGVGVRHVRRCRVGSVHGRCLIYQEADNSLKFRDPSALRTIWREQITIRRAAKPASQSRDAWRYRLNRRGDETSDRNMNMFVNIDRNTPLLLSGTDLREWVRGMTSLGIFW